MLNTAPGTELVKADSLVMASNDHRREPVKALRKIKEQISIDSDQRIQELGFVVVQKMCEGIAAYGIVGLYDDNETGQLQTEAYSADFSSPKISHLGVSIWREHSRPDRRERVLSITMLEHEYGSGHKNRGLSIEHWSDMPEGKFKFRFSVDGTDDGQEDAWNKVKRISVKNKLRFLRDILETEVDIRLTEDKFGAPYTPGALRSNSGPGEFFNYHGHWVRDMTGQLPALPGVTLALDSTIANER